MAGIDDKVVSIAFESSKFEQGVNKTIAALDKLKSALNFPAAGKALNAISDAAKKVDMSRIGKEVDNVKHSLDALRLVAISVMGQLAAQATRAAGRFIKAFTLDPVKAGFQEYSTNLNAVQTILANTQAAGTKLKDVNAALRELNAYSDKTIYNFSQMAKNIGTFTAAGVDLKTSTASIKGIANLAALSGSNAEQASTAMYQLSQAISAGSVKLQDWNSVVNAGMGGTVFQRALAQTAVAMGTLKDGAVKLEGPMKNVSINGQAFRNSLSVPGKSSWLTSKVLTATLQQFTGDLKDAELAAMGFNKAQIAAIQQTAKTAMHAATEVKTIAQVFDVAKETAGSGWAQTFQIIFGDFEEAKKTFTALSNTINGFINTNADARNKVLADWKALGGRTEAINAIRIAFHNLGMIIAPIKEAFRDVFPAVTGKSLYNLTLQFKAFAKALRPSQTTINSLRSTFRGLFAILDIGKQIIGGIVSMFGRLFGAIGVGSGGFLQFTARIGDYIYNLDKALQKSGAINKFFSGLGGVLAVPIKLVQKLADAIGELFSNFSSGGLSGGMNNLGESMGFLERMASGAEKAFDKLTEKFGDVGDIIRPIIEGYADALRTIPELIVKAAGNMNFEAILSVVRTGLFGALVLMFSKFFGKGAFVEQFIKGFSGLGGGILANIAGSFNALNGSLTAMQRNIQAKTLKEIAIAIALLTASVVALSFVDASKVSSSLSSIAIMLGELLGAMAILDKIAKSGGFLRLPVIAAGLIFLAGAVDLLVVAVFALSHLSWGELTKGLGGVAALLASLSGASIVLSKNSAGMIRSGIAIGIIAVAMNVLALAVKQFGGMDMASLGKGLGSVAVGLGTLAGAMKVMPKGIFVQSTALIALAIGLKLIASAVGQFANISWGGIAKGMAGIGGALVIIAGAMRVMPKGMVLQAAALLAVSVALGKIAAAIESMGGMSILTIAKGLGALAGALAILAGALYLMEGALPGAAALAVASGGISLLASALVKMGKMSWTSMIKSLVMLGAALAVIGVAGMLLTPTIPALLGFGAALLLIGAGLALAGAGIFLIGTGLSALVVALPTGVGVLVQAFKQLTQAVIENAKLFALAVLAIVDAFADVAPKFVDAAIRIVKALLDGITKAAPMLVPAANALINALLAILAQNQNKIIAAGISLLVALLTGIRNAIPQLVTLVVDIIVRFLSAISSNIGRIITAGSSILLAVIRGILQNVASITTTVVTIIVRFLTTIASQLPRIVTAGVSILTKLVEGIGKEAVKLVKAGTDAVVKFVTAIGNAGPRIMTAGRIAAGKWIDAVATEIPALANKIFTAVINLINGLALVIRMNTGPLIAAGFNLGTALLLGLIDGMMSVFNTVMGKIEWIGGKIKGAWNKVLSIFSPSKHTIWLGEMMMEGLNQGMETTAPKVYAQVDTIGKGVIKGFNDTFQTHSPSKVMFEIGQYITDGFAKGLRSGSEDVRSAWKELNDKLLEAQRGFRETIAEEQKKLKELREADKPDKKAIAEAQQIIVDNQKLLAQSVAGHKLMTGALRDEKAELIKTSNELDALDKKLQAATDDLIAKQKERKAAMDSYREQYSDLPKLSDTAADQIAAANAKIVEAQDNLNKTLAEQGDNAEAVAAAEKALADAQQGLKDVVGDRVLNAAGTEIDVLATYLKDLKGQADAVAAYTATLDQLRALGLDDATYRKLLKEGTADQTFANQLLAGGRTAVQGLNQLDRQLNFEADKLARQAGKYLYDAGVASAMGVVKGLKSKKKELVDAIDELAKEIIDAFKKELKIKSPSGVFAELGEFVMMGFAKGISGSTKMVADAMNSAAKDALGAMKSTISDISSVVMDQLDVNPVITPILDLTQVRARAGELGALTGVTPITAAASYGQASIISSEQLAAQSEEAATTVGGTHVTFEQNNYSPESLTEIEIYRQTKNQLSLLKSSLALT